MTPGSAVLVAFLMMGMAAGQRISTIQLDTVQYFVSRMNPYSPELNFFLAYQYCRSLGLQLASFETREKADSISQYLKNAGYSKFDFWTSGNRLGTDMMLWMSTGLPFNATFDYLSHDGEAAGESGEDPALNAARQLDVSALGRSCVALTGPELRWELHDCGAVKDFICEQTRCYYYNYGSIPVSAAQGGGKPAQTTSVVQASPSPAPASTASLLQLPTTPYPGLLENSVAPQENLDEDQEEEEEAALVEESPADPVKELGETADYSGPAMDDEEEGGITNVTPSSPHQAKRLEDLFPLERSRPIAWPRN